MKATPSDSFSRNPYPRTRSFAGCGSSAREPPREGVESGADSAREVGGAERTGLGNEIARGIDLSPHVPQEDSAHAPAGKIVDDTLPEAVLPVCGGLTARIHLADRLISEVE